jgi:hypothetical protein
MKYAFIALIAIYLVTYGCSSDNSEKATDSHETTATTSHEAQESEMAAAPADLDEPAVPAHDEHQFPAKNLETPVAVEEPAAVTELTEQPAEAVAVEPAEETPAVEQRVVAETDPATKEAQPAEVADSEMVVMPCGRTMARADIPENAPCLGQQPQAKLETAAEPDLEAAILKLAETTNDMIQATNQLIDATNRAISTVQAKQK